MPELFRSPRTLHPFASLQQLLLGILICAVSAFSNAAPAATPPWTQFKVGAQSVTVEKLYSAPDVIWGFDFIDAENLIFTEREGRISILNLKTGQAQKLSAVPAVWAKGQGGMLDVRIHPTEKNKIFFTYSAPVGKGDAATALAIAEISGSELKNVKQLFIANNANDDRKHFGSRIEFDGKGHLYFAIGDRDDRPAVQKLEFHNGKLIRLKLDGSVPADNPFVNTKGAQKEIWSLGHRSPQGLVINPVTQELWLGEMGPRGGDELNLIKPGLNYGWAEVTYGREYWGPSIGVKEKAGMEAPVAHWVPSISPSGMTFYTGDAVPAWKGSLFMGTLSGSHIRRLVIENGKVTQQEELLKGLGQRFRNVRTGPDGALYFSTDAGNIGRIR